MSNQETSSTLRIFASDLLNPKYNISNRIVRFTGKIIANNDELNAVTVEDARGGKFVV